MKSKKKPINWIAFWIGLIVAYGGGFILMFCFSGCAPNPVYKCSPEMIKVCECVPGTDKPGCDEFNPPINKWVESFNTYNYGICSHEFRGDYICRPRKDK